MTAISAGGKLGPGLSNTKMLVANSQPLCDLGYVELGGRPSVTLLAHRHAVAELVAAPIRSADGVVVELVTIGERALQRWPTSKP